MVSKSAGVSKSVRIPNAAGKARASSGKSMQSRLARKMRESILPGDTPFSGKPLTEAASFVLEAAMHREADRSVMQIASVGGQRRYLRIAIINDNMPFLVDSIAATIAAQGVSIDRLLHPILPVRRTAGGKLTDLGGAKAKARESMIYIETERLDARQRRKLERKLAQTLGDVRAAVSDWPKLQATMAEDISRLCDPENIALFEWLNGGMLTQLGHVTRKRDGSHANVLGICRKSARHLLSEISYKRAFAWFGKNDADGETRELLIVKANRVANVHRRVPLDLFIVPLRNESGRVEALSIHAGVWTSAALASPPHKVPGLRIALERLTQGLGFEPSSHAGKALVHALTALPHDLLTSFNEADVARVATAMMSLVDRPRPRLILVEAPLARHRFAFVWLPRELVSTQARLQIEDLLTGSDGTQRLDWSFEVEGGTLAMLRFVLDIRNAKNLASEEELDARLRDMLRGWNEAVEKHLAEHEEPNRAAAIAARYAAAFPSAYRSIHGPDEAASDLLRLRALDAHPDRNRDVRMFLRDGDPDDQLRLKIYQHKGALPLSDAVPALENFGFRVLSEIPTGLDGGELGMIHDFTLALPEGDSSGPLFDRADVIERAITAVLTGKAENDPFNRLVVGAALTAQQAEWLRAFYRYLRQAGMGFTIYTVVDALRAAPHVTRAMIDLFIARHDPDFAGDRKAAVKQSEDAFRRGLSKVAAINDDRLLRLYYALIGAILRTNCFAPAASEALAFKIDSSMVPGLPKPIPWREIFVYSRRVEGIHLRSGPIARGGLRWSDRRDDFRTEILGLMKAQRVKNAVIVPTGAKGGFYPKLLPSPTKDRDGWAAEGQGSYEVFIRTLLSVTDNIVGGKVVHPDRVIAHDGEDPYFVVAADKGTARFSDVANAIAEQAGFWLDDAFASGGSNGYDHKAMGITARGAWVSVQRHFLEMGIDVQKDPVRVVGCGDMSGDVFGNGMLLSKAIKLVAAFDHRHIFIDPDPDPARSWTERKRLYDLPRSSWEDYDPTLISRGGGVFSRESKRIKLSAQARKALDIEDRDIEPDALISAILKSPVDLVWFGGIGTYIKAETENNVQVGDPANDTLRVDASDVRARVIGEGANLGVTQAGRIAFSLKGGRLNTDFIDNSAGVDCSDNEVNIKIALAAAAREGKISAKARNTLLEAMTDEVAAIVLEDNRLQALALSVAESGKARSVASHLRLIETLEDMDALDRKTEGLADHETLLRRASDGIGLTRPELAVLLSSAKLVLQDAIEASPVPDDPAMEDKLIAGFPAPMQAKFAKQIREHRLRRELIATELANRLVNRIGLVHPFQLAEEEGVQLSQVAAAFVAAEKLFDLESLWRELDEAPMGETARLMLFERQAAAATNLMSDILRTTAGQVRPEELHSDLGKGVGILSDSLDELLTTEWRKHSSAMLESFVAAGAPEKLAGKVTRLFELDGSVGLARLAAETGIAPKQLTRAFTSIGARLGIDWAQGTAALMNSSDVWERLLVAGLARDFQQMRIEFLRRIMRRKSGKSAPEETVEEWAVRNDPAIRQFRAMIGRAQSHSTVAPAMLAQIASQARNLLER